MLKVILLVLGVIAVCDAFTHMFAEMWYKNHPYAEKTAYFETLDAVFRHKYVRPLSIVLGVVCAAVGILI